MSARWVFNLGAVLIGLGLLCLLAIERLSLPWSIVLGLLGLALACVGVALIEFADEALEVEA
ncbi:hypothetical protein [Deinococcus sp.]|uniref:hypothetical protein n=1 Tax=Deinococcus sp. TaxID=47478 RepID=UPI0025F40514|nr:hypothetical protein [Deinococcus sp.]